MEQKTRCIDLRSDTVTKPSMEMRQAMVSAEVGDDVFGEDPTVNRLEAMGADILGKEAALFVASGTMGNQVAIRTHTRPGDQVLLDVNSHIFNYEAGAPGAISGVQTHPLHGPHGILSAEQIEAAISPDDIHCPPTCLICLENTHNRAGGTVYPLEEMKNIRKVALDRGVRMHLDGARLFNASVATGIPVREYASNFDSVLVCLSKGLGAPVGSLLSGDAEFIHKARRNRKMFGGGMRQAGILAAAGIYALQYNVDRLAEDHRRARELSEEIGGLPGCHVSKETVQTNIVVFELNKEGQRSEEIVDKLRVGGVLVVPFGPRTIRAVTHLDVDDEDIRRAIRVFKQVFGQGT